MFGARCSFTFHILSIIGSITSLVGSILTPTVFFNIYKEHTQMTEEDMNGFDMISGICVGTGIGFIMNMYCLQRRGIIMPIGRCFKEVCCPPSNNIVDSSEIGVSVSVGADSGAGVGGSVGSKVHPENTQILKLHKNPQHYYTPSSKRVYRVSDIRITPSVNLNSSFHPINPGNIRNSTFKNNKNFKQSYAKYSFTPTKNTNETNHEGIDIERGIGLGEP
jgi:hypothetical protein